MQLRKLFSLFLALSILLTLAGCQAETPSETNKFQTGQVTPVEYGAVADLYIPKTGIVNPPTVVQEITAETGFPDRDRSPAVCILHIDKDMQVVEGDRVLTTVDTFLSLNRDRIIPAFYIDSEEDAAALLDYLKKQNIIDAYVMAHSSQAELVKEVRSQYRSIQGALWFDDIADQAARKEALLLCNRSLAAVLCCHQPLSVEDTAYFNARLLSAWSWAKDAAGVYRAIASGYNGVICHNTDTVFDVYAGNTRTTVCGTSIPIGHRGDYYYLENTVASYQRAMEQYNCAAVEIDLRLSSDGEIILMHDKTVDRTTNGSGTLAEMPLASLKQLQVTAGGQGDTAPIPTFEDALQAFQDTELVLVCHINVLTDTMINRFNELVEKYQYHDRIIAFLSYSGIVSYNYQNITPGVGFACGTQDSLLADVDPLKVIENFIRSMNVFHFQPLFYDYVTDSTYHANPEFYYQMCARGYLNWHSTTTLQNKTESSLLTETGAAAALLNTLSQAEDFFYYLEAEDLTVKAGEKLPEKLTGVGQTETAQYACQYLQISGDPLTDGTMQSPGTATVVYYADLRTPLGTPYRILSNPVTVTFTS